MASKWPRYWAKTLVGGSLVELLFRCGKFGFIIKGSESCKIGCSTKAFFSVVTCNVLLHLPCFHPYEEGRKQGIPSGKNYIR